MKPECERMVSDVLPAVRALVAKDLIDKYGFTQKQTAIKMGLTQPAISQYYKNSRGYNTKLLEKHPEISKRIDEISKGLATSEIDINEASMMFCSICESARDAKLLEKISS